MTGDRPLPDSVARMARRFCGCGIPEKAWETIRNHLLIQSLDFNDRPEEWPYEDGRDLFVAYVLDDMGYTEHGGSIGAAWLTQDGKELLAFLEEHGSDWMDKEWWQDSEGVSWGPGF